MLQTLAPYLMLLLPPLPTENVKHFSLALVGFVVFEANLNFFLKLFSNFHFFLGILRLFSIYLEFLFRILCEMPYNRLYFFHFYRYFLIFRRFFLGSFLFLFSKTILAPLPYCSQPPQCKLTWECYAWAIRSSPGSMGLSEKQINKNFIPSNSWKCRESSFHTRLFNFAWAWLWWQILCDGCANARQCASPSTAWL